jgi:uncharacterized protein YecE (DUF72 family)
MAIRIGIGSWADPEYLGLLYPKGFPPDMKLCAYAMWFDHVEVNASYYAIPRTEAVKTWVEQTPPHFLFDIRLPRAISQSPEKAGKDGRLLDILLKSMTPLIKTKKLGTFLLVMSPFFSPERHRLEELDPLIKRIRPHSLAVELRHSGWVSDKLRASTLDFFRDRKLTWVAVDMPQVKGSDIMPPVDEVTHAPLAYIRLHGRNLNWFNVKSAAERHTYFYSDRELQELAKRIRLLAGKAKDLRVVCNNHALDYAPKTAMALKEILGET